MALLLPSFPLGGGVLTDYATKKWTFTAYPDTACTAAYGVESAQVSIYKIELDDTLADGTVGTAYTGTVAATGGTGPYTYAVTSGALPAGLSLSSGGAVTGTPTTAATSAFTITATDANGSTGNRAYSVTVAPSDLCLLSGAHTLQVTVVPLTAPPVWLTEAEWHDAEMVVSPDLGGGLTGNAIIGSGKLNDVPYEFVLTVYIQGYAGSGQIQLVVAPEMTFLFQALQPCGTTNFNNEESTYGGSISLSIKP
jgi:hypothetical protein